MGRATRIAPASSSTDNSAVAAGPGRGPELRRRRSWLVRPELRRRRRCTCRRRARPCRRGRLQPIHGGRLARQLGRPLGPLEQLQRWLEVLAELVPARRNAGALKNRHLANISVAAGLEGLIGVFDCITKMHRRSWTFRPCRRSTAGCSTTPRNPFCDPGSAAAARVPIVGSSARSRRLALVE